MKDLSKQLKAIANERRLKIIALLSRGDRHTMGDIARAIKLSFRSTSRHLHILDRVQLIDHEQVGPFVYFWINKQHPVFKCFSSLL